MIDDVTTALARAHRDDLSREAARVRLARLATCCQQSSLRGLLSRWRGSDACAC